MAKIIEHRFDKSDCLFRLGAEGVVLYRDDHIHLVRTTYTLNGKETDTIYQVVNNEQAT